MTFTITDENDREYWITDQCAAYCGINVRTWSSYVSRGQAPAIAAYLNPRTPLWSVDEVRAWHAARPSTRRQSVN